MTDGLPRVVWGSAAQASRYPSPYLDPARSIAIGVELRDALGAYLVYRDIAMIRSLRRDGRSGQITCPLDERPDDDLVFWTDELLRIGATAAGLLVLEIEQIENVGADIPVAYQRVLVTRWLEDGSRGPSWSRPCAPAGARWERRSLRLSPPAMPRPPLRREEGRPGA